jgi:hypothetical protein
MHASNRSSRRALRGLAAAALIVCATALPAVPVSAQQAQRTFATADAAVHALADAAKAGNLQELIAIFAPHGQELADASDPATARRNREVFVTAFKEGWRLTNVSATRKTLVIGNEQWPFPVPLVKTGARWRFDGAAGKEEVLARRIGRNELNAIAVCRTYVTAQQRYAAEAHDGKPAGGFAMKIRSDAGKHDGLYWPAVKGAPRSPLGDLLADAAPEERNPATPFHGYHFRILTGPALVAWPAEYGATGVMTFLVDQTGKVRQKDLGPETATAAKAIARYAADASWTLVK